MPVFHYILSRGRQNARASTGGKGILGLNMSSRTQNTELTALDMDQTRNDEHGLMISDWT